MLLMCAQVKQALNASSIMVSTCVGSWDFAFDPCDSRASAHFTCGVDCSAAVLGVARGIGIRLECGAGYSGPLSPAIGNLTALQRLIVSGNAFHGHIPAALGALTKMFQLDLSMNNFTGRLPASLGALSNLGYLSVGYNSLQGPIPETLNQLRNLTFLYLNDNYFTGAIPTLAAMSSLSVFDASGNNLIGTLPSFNLPTRVAEERVHRPFASEPQKPNTPPSAGHPGELPHRENPLLPLQAPGSAAAQPLPQLVLGRGAVRSWSEL